MKDNFFDIKINKVSEVTSSKFSNRIVKKKKKNSSRKKNILEKIYFTFTSRYSGRINSRNLQIESRKWNLRIKKENFLIENFTNLGN